MSANIFEVLSSGTEKQFSDAVNASFEPISRLGYPEVTRLYTSHKEALPFDVSTHTNVEQLDPPLDIQTITALNAMHALVEARRANIPKAEAAIATQLPGNLVFVENAFVEVIQAVALAQQAMVDATDGRYIDRSVLGQTHSNS